MAKEIINQNCAGIEGADTTNQSAAKQIRELRESVGMSRKAFSLHTGIPVRTLEDWEASRRTPPEYIPRLIAYQLKYEKVMQEKDTDVTDKK